jgi:hypothetical protein
MGDFMARRQLALFTAALAAAFGPSAAFGQYGGAVQQPQVQKQELHGKGELEAVGGGGLKAVLDGQPWLIKFDPKVKVTVTGSATADALVPGLFVKFKGEFDKKGKASEEIKELEIFTPNEKDPLGAKSSGNPFDSPAPKKGPLITPTRYDIAGRITGIKKGTITVACPGMTVHADVASDAMITVNIADPTVASAGDKIEVKGWYVKGQEGRGYAAEVTVQLANQLTGPKKKGLHSAKAGDKSTDPADAASPDDKKPTKGGAKAADPKPAPGKAADTKKPGDPEPSADKDKAAAK